jgi:hypothetical protein
VAYTSGGYPGPLATDLIAGLTITNTAPQVFLYDRLLNQTFLVSHNSASTRTTGNAGSVHPQISADGNFIVFLSGATDLVPGQVEPSSNQNVFLYDRVAGTITLVSHSRTSSVTTAIGLSSIGGALNTRVLSRDGRFIAFNSTATNLVAGQTDNIASADIFLFDRLGGTNTLVSHDSAFSTTTASGASSEAAISADGNFVGFQSDASDLVPGQVVQHGPSIPDVFLYNRLTANNTLVSHVPGSSTTGSVYGAVEPELDGAGNFVLFRGSDFGLSLYNRLTGSNTSVGGGSGLQQISEDGNFVSSDSPAGVHLYDRVAGTDTLVGIGGNFSALSSDGRYLAFRSDANNVVNGQIDTNGGFDVFIYDRVSRTNRLVSHASRSDLTTGNDISLPDRGFSMPVISGDGGSVVYESNATNLVAGLADNNNHTDVFVYDVGTNTNAAISRRDPGLVSVTPNGPSSSPAVSADGRYTAFVSLGNNLVPGQRDDNFASDVFLYDRVTGSTTLVSHTNSSSTATANGASSGPAISADGRFVVFVSSATELVPGQSDSNGGTDVFLFDRLGGGITLVSHSTASGTSTGNAASTSAVVSADGNYVAFVSSATDLVAGATYTHPGTEVLLYSRANGALTLISHAAGSTATGDNFSQAPALSADGRFVADESKATNLMPGQNDANNAVDVFLYDRTTGGNRLVSHAPGDLLTAAGGMAPAVSADGNTVAYETPSEVYVFDRTTGASALAHAAMANVGVTPAVTSGNGRFVAYATYVPGHLTITGQVYVYDTVLATETLVSHVSSAPAVAASGRSDQPTISADGRFIAYQSTATNLAPGQQYALI